MGLLAPPDFSVNMLSPSPILIKFSQDFKLKIKISETKIFSGFNCYIYFNNLPSLSLIVNIQHSYGVI